MKRFFAVAAIAALFLTSCNQAKELEEVSTVRAEMKFSIANIATKGYVEGASFDDTAFDKLHEGTNPTNPRSMTLSAYLYPQSGASSNYFVGETFSVDNEDGDARRWHHTPAIYWPMGGKLSFLAYSVTEPFDGTAVKWSSDNAASQVVLNVSDQYIQDDILYSGVYQRNSGATVGDPGSTGTPATDVEMTFQHAQAWIEFQIKSQTPNIVKLNEIVVKNINSRGQLTINAPASASAEAAAVWDFNYVNKRDLVVPDTYNVYNNPDSVAANKPGFPRYIGTEVKYFDFLLPGSQDQTEFLLHYQLEGQDNILEYSYKLTGSKWNMGNKYIYEIEFRPYEIIVKPIVTTWDGGDVPSDFPSVLE